MTTATPARTRATEMGARQHGAVEMAARLDISAGGRRDAAPPGRRVTSADGMPRQLCCREGGLGACVGKWCTGQSRAVAARSQMPVRSMMGAAPSFFSQVRGARVSDLRD